MSFLNELKRRNVLRVAAAYLVCAWLVIQVVETIFPAFGFGDAAVRIVTIVFAIGLIPTLIFAWAFELTPEGLKKESEVDRSQSISPHTGKKLDRMIMVVLALALGYFAFDKFVLEPQREAALLERNEAEVEQALQKGRTEARVESYGDKSIAVLAFQDMSQKKDQEYLSDGIAEELLNLLAKVPDLRVISRSSSFSYKGKDVKLAQVAEELNIAHILEGSVRKAGNRIRITAQLIDARSDTHLWSETYDRQLDDIFAIQDEIARAIVESLKQPLELESAVSPQRAKVVGIEAYDLYLEGLHAYNQGSTGSWLIAKDYFTRAIEMEPDFADAWYRLARTHYRLLSSGHSDVKSAEAAALKAIELDPSLGGAYTALSLIYPSWDPKTTPQLREKAFKYSPNDAWVVLQYGRALEWQSRAAEADQYISRAVQIDPLNQEYRTIYGLFNMYRGRVEKGLGIIEDVLDSHPEYAPAWETLGYIRGWLQGDLVGAVNAIHRAIELDTNEPRWCAVLATFYAALEDFENARQWLDRANAISLNNPQARILINEKQIKSLVPRVEYMILRASGQIEAAHDLVIGQLADDGPLPTFFQKVLAADLIEDEAWDAAEAFIFKQSPDVSYFINGPIPTGIWDWGAKRELENPGGWVLAAYLQFIYRRTGNKEIARAMTERLKYFGMEGRLQSDLESTAKAYFWEAQKLAWEGMDEAALDALEIAVQQGWRAWQFESWQLLIRDNVLFRDIRNHPRFLALLELIETDMARQRAELAAGLDLKR